MSISASSQCSSVPRASATSMPHISAYHQCHLSMPISATYQCCQSVPPISASQGRLSVRISATYQCQSVPPNSASQCCLTVPVS
ncbi:unnamed protein product, partial [Staurois parvus]